MPRYNRRSRWNWERAGQGAISGAATGFSVGGPKGAAAGAGVGFVTGGLSGRDTTIDRIPYDRAIRDFSKLRKRSARFAADEHSAQTGASFQARGLNTSELAGGVIAANRGRFMRGAETDIAKFTADINLRIAQAEQQAQMADDELTRQGWLDLAGQLGLMAISGEFTPDPELSEGMLASLRRSHPKDVEKWIRGRITDEELIGIYTRYAKLHGQPGTLQRRFSDLEMNVDAGKGPVPEAHLPEAESTIGKSAYEVPGAKEAASRAHMNIEGKEIVPIQEGDSEVVQQAKTVIPKEEYEILKTLEPDFESLITGEPPVEVSPNLTTSWRETRERRTETDVEPMGADEPWWHPDFLAEQSDAKLLDMLDAMREQLADPNQTEAFKQRAQLQIDLIGQEIQNRMWPGSVNTETESRPRDVFIPPIEHPGNRAAAEAAHQRVEADRAGQRESRILVPRREIDLPEVEAPRAERKGKPNPLPRKTGGRDYMRWREEQGGIETQTTPPPPPDLEGVPVETTPPEPTQRADTSSGRARTMKAEAAPPDNPLVKEAYRMVGKMEDTDKAALMKYFDDAKIKYFGESVDPTIVAWCAVYLNAALIKAGYVPLDTETYAARGFMNYGTEGTGAVGDIIVYDNHVGIIVQKSGSVIKILGGNQKDGVTVIDKSELDKKMSEQGKAFLGYRKPVQTRGSRRNPRGRSRFSDVR